MQIVPINHTDMASDDDQANEPIDLAELAHTIAGLGPLPESYIAGKTAIRDTVMRRLTCSAAQAESIVDQMESAGLIRFTKRRVGPLIDAHWTVEVAPTR